MPHPFINLQRAYKPAQFKKYMRQLTKSQKRLLDKTIASNKDIFSIDDLPSGIFEELEKINDTEILYQEANRYIRNAQWRETK